MVLIIGTIVSMVLSTMSLLSFLLGAGLAGVGTFLLVSKDQLRGMINLVDTSKLPSAAEDAKGEAQELLDKFDVISTVGVAILIVGAFIAGVSFCGGIGSMCKLKLLLLVYIIVTGVMLVALLIGILYFGTLKARMDEQILKQMNKIKDNFFVSLISVVQKPDSTQAIMTVAFNFMQVGLKCCGVSELGDVRNSTTWLASERRLTELNKQLKGKMPMSDDVPNPKGALADDTAGIKVPDWLKDQMPVNFTQLPKGVTVPAELPKSFKLPPDFKENLAELAKANNFSKEALDGLFSAALTIKTPLTCCELSSESDDLMSGKSFDVKDITKLMKNPACPFSANNADINEKTCYVALLDYISTYQKWVVSVGTVLAIVIGVGVGCALWIFLFE